LYPVAGLWSLVAYVITPTNETTYLYYVNTNVTPYTTNLFQNSLNIPMMAEAFGTTTYLGTDAQQQSSRTFNGFITETAVYTNALSQQQVLKLFLAALGSSGAPVSPPSTLTSPSLFAGESVQIDGTAGGSAPISYQWMSSSNGTTWTDVPADANYSGVTSPILQINNAILANALLYEVVAKNNINTATSGVSTVSVTPVPTGLWTMNFQLTNDTLNFGTSSTGAGPYDGHGVLGTGTYWNAFVNDTGTYVFSTWNTASDLLDDGVTHAGIYASVNGSDDSSLITAPGAGSISTLLDQFAYGSSALTFTGVPDGTYNLIIYGIDGGFADASEALTVEATNGTQSATMINDQDKYFSPGGNSELFTNVQIAGGTLSVGIATGGTTGRYTSCFNGAQLQLVSYAATVSSDSLALSVTNNTLTLSWPEGVLQTSSNLINWVVMPDPSPVTVTATNASQFFRLMIPKP
jgi:hypothetical protein